MTDAPPATPHAFRPAGYWVRAGARILDILTIVAVYNVFYLAYRLGADAGLWPPLALEDVAAVNSFSAGRVLFGVFVFGFPVFYYVYLHAAYGQTFGKMAFRIRVVNEDGSPIDARKSFLRWLGYFLSGELTVGLGYAWAAIDRRKQALHDKVCRTLVVYAEPPEPAPGRAPDRTPDRS